MEVLTDGILLIDKAQDETSYDVVRRVKTAIKGLKISKIGHAGTLDPFATGLLVLLLGQGTKLSRFVMLENKVYVGTVSLGVETDTLDSTGKTVRTNPVPDLTVRYVKKEAMRFVGEIEQVPPAYSAVKYKGRRSYKLARNGFEFILKRRKVQIHLLKVISVELPEVTIEVECSGGTYMRSLAADLSRALGAPGHLKSLRRMSCGSFEVQNALGSKDIAEEAAGQCLFNRVISLRNALPGMYEIEVEKGLAERIRNGYQAQWVDLHGTQEPPAGSDVCEYTKIVSDGELVAIVKSERDRGIDHGALRIERVFV